MLSKSSHHLEAVLLLAGLSLLSYSANFFGSTDRNAGSIITLLVIAGLVLTATCYFRIYAKSKNGHQEIVDLIAFSLFLFFALYAFWDVIVLG